MRKLIRVELRHGGPCPQGLPNEDPGTPLLPDVRFEFDDETLCVYLASYFEGYDAAKEVDHGC